MTLRWPSTARATLRRYRSLPFTTQAHVWLRWLTCPFPAVEGVVPRTGRILDVGCGHGLLSLFLAQSSATRVVVGVDIDANKLREARHAGRGSAVTFDAVAADWLPAAQHPWDGVVLVDVLYLLGTEAGTALLAAAAGALGPGGRIVVKEIALEPRWKYRLAVAQERAATRSAITAGSVVDFLAPSQIVSVLRGAGLSVTQRRIDRGYPHPHLLVVGDRPAAV